MQLKIAGTIEESAENPPVNADGMYAVEIIGKGDRDLRSLRVLRIGWRDLYIYIWEQDYIDDSRENNKRNIRDTRITIEDALSKHWIARAHLSSTRPVIHATCSRNVTRYMSLRGIAAAILVVSLRIP